MDSTRRYAQFKSRAERDKLTGPGEFSFESGNIVKIVAKPRIGLVIGRFYATIRAFEFYSHFIIFRAERTCIADISFKAIPKMAANLDPVTGLIVLLR
jgi:hypothetical protein